jgi:hypothetical protein
MIHPAWRGNFASASEGSVSGRRFSDAVTPAKIQPFCKNCLPLRHSRRSANHADAPRCAALATIKIRSCLQRALQS